MSEPLAILLVAEAVLFPLAMGLGTREKTQRLGEYLGLAFHLLLLPVIAAFPGGPIGQGAGIAWIACDVVAGVGLIWTARDHAQIGRAVFWAVRMAGHLLAAVWVSLVSLALGGAALPIGFMLAVGLAGYTLAAGRLPQKALALPGVLMVVWLAMLAWHATQLAA